jgi:ubiquinone/menaquinone biosynthesis C-methylase UbiE
MTEVSNEVTRSHEYELGHSESELKRLSLQAKLVDPITRQFFHSAGIAAGMTVLDVGSGAGDVTFLAAELVGLKGKVIGVDRSPTAVAAAQARAKARLVSNVSFRSGDPTELTFDQPFDAIVGRYVLMFSPDPVAMLRGLAASLRPGGVIVFHEPDWRGAASFPPSKIYDNCVKSIERTFQKVGSKTTLGIGLYSAFQSAGLPAPTMGLQALVGGGSGDLNGLDMIADLVKTMAPVMEQSGVTTMAELAPATLYERMRKEAIANGSVVVGRYEVGAWARTTTKTTP